MVAGISSASVTLSSSAVRWNAAISCSKNVPVWILSGAISTLPLSIREKSRISEISVSRWLPCISISRSDVAWSAVTGPYSCSITVSACPRMTLSGVRSSWLIFAKKLLLAAFDASARSFWRRSSIVYSADAASASLRSVMSQPKPRRWVI